MVGVGGLGGVLFLWVGFCLKTAGRLVFWVVVL